jgi:hypothetical protein
MVRPTFAAAALSAVLFGSACTHDQGQVKDVRAEANANAAQRLQGRWVLTSFEPQVPLEPVFQLILTAQIEHMVVEAKGQTLNAQGPGLSVTRTFRVEEAYLDHFRATVFDAYGVGVDTMGDFMGNTVVVNALTGPFRGRAGFRRAP